MSEDKVFDFDVVEPLPEAMTGFELKPVEPDFVNVSGVDEEPLWVERCEIAAVGVFGKDSSMIILKDSGFQLKAKGIHPNEVMGIISGLGDEVNEDTVAKGSHVSWTER